MKNCKKLVKLCGLVMIIFTLTTSTAVYGVESANIDINYNGKKELVIGKEKSFNYDFQCREESYVDEFGCEYPPTTVCDEISDVISTEIYLNDNTTYIFDLKQSGAFVIPKLQYKLVVGKEVDTTVNKIKDIEYVISWEGPERQTYVGENGQIVTIWDAEEDRKYRTFTLSKGKHYIALEFFSDDDYFSNISGTYSIMPLSLDEEYVSSISSQKPVLSKSKSTYSSVSLKWNELEGVEKYQVYYSTKKDSGYKRYATYNKDTKTTTVKGLATGKTYYFKVRGYTTVDKKNIYTKYSNIISEKTKIKAPTSVYVEKNTYNSLKVTWKGVDGATYYELHRREGDKGSWKKIKTYTKDVREAKVTSLKTGTYYHFKVRARRYSGDDAVYSSYSNVDYARPQLSKPIITVTKKNSSSVKVSWKAISGANGYQLYYAVGNGTYKKVYTASSKETDVLVYSLKKGKTYGYKVRAYRNVDGKKVYSSFSAVVKKKM